MASQTRQRRHRRWAPHAAAATIVSGIMASGVMVWNGSQAAFSGATTNAANAWSAGNVELRDDDGGGTDPLAGAAMFTATGIKPAAAVSAGSTRCIKVTYHGTVAGSTVKIYGKNITGTLGYDMLINVDVGTAGSGGSFADCTGFVLGSNLVTNKTLSVFATDHPNHTNGLDSGWAPAAAGESRVFRISYRLSVDTGDNRQGATAGMNFVWETQST